MISRIVDLPVRAWTLLTCGQRPRNVRQLVKDLRTDDRGGMSSETVIIIGILIAIAIAVGTLVSTKIIDKAESIHF